MQQYPAGRAQNFFLRKLRGVPFIHRRHHLVGNLGKSRFPAVIIIHDAGGGRRVWVNDMILFFAQNAARFAQMMVEREMRAFDIGQIRRDVVRRDLDFAVLHVFRMREFDVVNHVQFFQQHGAD